MLAKFDRIAIPLLAILCVLLVGSAALGATIVFQPSSGDWNTAEHWDLNRVPNAGDDVVIDSGKTCKIENMSTLAFAKTINVDGTLEIRGESLVLGATTHIDTTSNVDGNVYFEKVEGENAVLACRGAIVTINGTGALNASKGVNSSYEGILACCAGLSCANSGDGFLFGSTLTVNGSFWVASCVEINGTAKVDHQDDVMQVGDGVGMSCVNSECDGLTVSGTGKFKVTAGLLRLGVADYRAAAAPKWEISGGEIEIFANGNFDDTHIKITAEGGTIDFGDDFQTDAGVEFTNTTVIKAAGKTVLFD